MAIADKELITLSAYKEKLKKDGWSFARIKSTLGPDAKDLSKLVGIQGGIYFSTKCVLSTPTPKPNL